MKAIGILHHDCSPNYFWDELCGSVAIFTNPQIFSYPERSTRSHVDEPKCNSQFLTMVTQMKYLFFIFHIMQNEFCTRYVGPTSCMSPDNLCSSTHEFQSSGGGLDPLQQRNVCSWADYSLQSRFDPAVSSHLFPCSAIQHSHRDACCQQQHRCLTAAHNQQHSQAPFQEFVWQCILPSTHHHEFCKHRAKPSMQPHLVHRALPWPYSLAPADGQHSQEGQPYRCNVPILQKSIVCEHWSITAHAFIHQTCMAKRWQKTNKSYIIWVHTFTHLFKMFKSFLTTPMHGTSSKYSIPSDHILRWHLVEHSPNILNAPTFCICQPSYGHKNICSKPLWMICSWAHQPSSSATMLAHAFSTPTKVTKLGCTPSCWIFGNSAKCPFPLAAFHMSQYHGGPSDHILRWHLVEHSPSLLNAPTRLLHTKTSDSQPLWMSCSWTSLLSSSLNQDMP